MKFVLHHVGVVCRDFDYSLSWYKSALNNTALNTWQASSEGAIAFVGRGSDVMIELVRSPYEPYGRKHLDRRGPTLSHLGVWVDDLNQAFELFRKDGLNIVWEPRDVCYGRHFAVLDPQGVLLEFIDTGGGPGLAKAEPTGSVRFHHVSLLTSDLRRTEQFFARNLHMKTIIEHTENDGGFLFMIDEGFDFQTHNFMLEVIGPPRTKVATATALLEPREQAILERHGSCLDHLCYIADDVPSAHREFTARGAVSEVEPYRDYGSWISWLKDPDQNDIELLSPIPQTVVEFAIKRRTVLQTISVNFDAGKKEMGSAPPPWRSQQLENLRKQR